MREKKFLRSVITGVRHILRGTHSIKKTKQDYMGFFSPKGGWGVTPFPFHCFLCTVYSVHHTVDTVSSNSGTEKWPDFCSDRNTDSVPELRWCVWHVLRLSDMQVDHIRVLPHCGIILPPGRHNEASHHHDWHHHHHRYSYHHRHHDYLFPAAFFTLSPSSSQRLRWTKMRKIETAQFGDC